MGNEPATDSLTRNWVHESVSVIIHAPPRNVNTKMHFFCGIVQIFDINIIFNDIGVSSEQGSPKNRAGGLVAGHQSFSCGELHHPSGLQGQRFVRFRIGFTARRVLRTTQRNWREQGFSTCKRREARASRQGRLSIRMRDLSGIQDGEEWDS